jgi:hypothetical protein
MLTSNFEILERDSSFKQPAMDRELIIIPSCLWQVETDPEYYIDFEREHWRSANHLTWGVDL